MSPAQPTAGAGWIGRHWLALVVAVSALCFGVHADLPGDVREDEPRYFATALTAHETGDWVVLRFGDEPRLKKPPLQVWLIGLSYELFGVGLWQARLPSIAAGVGAVGLVAWLASLLFGSRRAALYSACVLLSSELFLRQARCSLTDTGLAFLVLLSWCGFALALRGRRPGAWLAWGAMGLGLLQKGPVAVALPAGTFAIWLAWEGRTRPISWRPLVDPAALALFAAVVVPWPLVVIAHLGLDAFVEPVARELGLHLTTSPVGMAEQIFSYTWDLVRCVLPFTPLLLFGLRREDRDGATRLLWMWAGVFWLVFILFVLKHRWRYMVPAIPALAILAGHALDVLQRRVESGARLPPELRLLRWSVALWLAGTAVVGALLVFTAARVVGTVASVVVAGVLCASAALLAIAMPWLHRRLAPHAWVVVAAVGIALLNTLRTASLPAGFPSAAPWLVAHRHLRDRPAPVRVATVGLNGPRRGWAWLGAGRSLPDFAGAARREAGEVGSGAPDWEAIGAYDVLIADAASIETMPASLRRAYRETDRVRGVRAEVDLAWSEPSVERARARWHHGGVVVLLERSEDP